MGDLNGTSIDTRSAGSTQLGRFGRLRDRRVVASTGSIVLGWVASGLVVLGGTDRLENMARIVAITGVTLLVANHLSARRIRWALMAGGVVGLGLVAGAGRSLLVMVTAGVGLVAAVVIAGPATPIRRSLPAGEAGASGDRGNVLVSESRSPRPWAIGSVLRPAAAWGAATVLANWLSFGNRFPPFIDTKGRLLGDFWFYRTIAQHGYPSGQGLEVGYPAFPLLLRALGPFLGGIDSAAIVLAALAGLGATVLFWRWTEVMGLDRRAQWGAVGFFVFYPYAQSLHGIGYPDSSLVALAVASLLLVESRRYVLAGLVAAVATAMRPNALPLVPALLLLTWERSGVLELGAAQQIPLQRLLERPRSVLQHCRLHWERFRMVCLAPALSLLGIGAYSAWLWGSTGDPLRFWTAQHEWGHFPATRITTWLKVPVLQRFDDYVSIATPWRVADDVLTFALIAMALLFVPAIARRFGLGYAALVAGLAVIPIAASDGFFTPGGRLLLPAFPVVALVAERLSSRPRWLGVTVGSTAALFLLATYGFANGYWS